MQCVHHQLKPYRNSHASQFQRLQHPPAKAPPVDLATGTPGHQPNSSSSAARHLLSQSRPLPPVHVLSRAFGSQFPSSTPTSSTATAPKPATASITAAISTTTSARTLQPRPSLPHFNELLAMLRRQAHHHPATPTPDAAFSFTRWFPAVSLRHWFHCFLIRSSQRRQKPATESTCSTSVATRWWSGEALCGSRRCGRRN